MEGNLWQTWTESKSREDGGALGQAAEKISRLDGKKLNQRESFVYLCGVVGGHGGTDGNLQNTSKQVHGGKWKV